MSTKPKGRPKKYAEYDALVAGLPKGMAKRPKYINAIGVFKGSKSDTAWVKLRLPHGGIYGGRSYPSGAAIEIKLGKLTSWTWKDLEAKRDDLQGKADRDEPLEDEASVLFSDWAADWLGRFKKWVRAFETAEIHLNTHILPAFGKKTLDAIRVQDFNKYISSRLSKAKPSSVKRELGTLNAILNDAVRAGHLEVNPGRHADKKWQKGIIGRQRFLNAEERTALLAKAEETAGWLKDFILFALYSGMRRGEILGLLWSDVITLPKGNQIVLVRNTKSDQPRMVPCNDTMNLVLECQKGRQKDQDERVFPIALKTLKRNWKKAQEASGLHKGEKRVTIHDLRRTNATEAVVAGVDLRTLAGRLGHGDLSMLEKHYAVLVGSASEEAAEKIEKALSLPAKPA